MRRGDTMNRFRITPIGTVLSPYKTKDEAPHQGKDEIVEIEIDDAFSEGLKDVDQFTHLHIFYYLHESEGFSLLTRTPWDEKEHGLFATRSPNRPTPIGYAVVELIERKGNILKVKGLDAIDGTLVLDIKPYSPDIDARPEASKGWLSPEKEGFTPRVYTWKTQVTWKEGKEGVLHDTDKKSVRIGCPPDFGGKPVWWSPQQLFISSVEVCLLTTFLNMLAKRGYEIQAYCSRAEGKAQLVDGIFRFTEVALFPVVTLSNSNDRDAVLVMLQRAKEKCMVVQSSRITVSMTPELITEMSDGD
jgi:tRNA-Thr(GGU) m(6)t(6)A37 methyltransferase TsaA